MMIILLTYNLINLLKTIVFKGIPFFLLLPITKRLYLNGWLNIALFLFVSIQGFLLYYGVL